METITTNAKVVELTGEETQVHFTSAFPYFWARNDSGSTVLMSISPNIEEGGDGVIEVLAGSSAGTMHGFNSTRNDLYLLGSGRVQIMGTYTPENPFKTAQKGGGESVINKYISNGLIYQTSYISSLKTLTNLTTYDYNNYIYFPATIEFCGIYSETSVNGYWFNIQNGYDEIYVGANQYDSAFRLYLFKKSYGGDQTTITIEPNETATISIVYESKNLISLYKNGMFIKNFNDSLPSISSIEMRKINIMSNFRDGNLNSLRIYNRKLTESEMLHNFSVDKALFF